MLVGIPKEIKNHEYRVGLTPASVKELTVRGHDVIVETLAGSGIGFSDHDYEAVGAKIVATAETIFEDAQLIVKVKEPQPEECRRLQPEQILFTFLHLAADELQTQLLQDAGCVAIAYETVTDNHGALPLLAPMSEVAGRMAVQAGAYCLEKAHGGSGVLLGGVPGVQPANVLVIGGGVVGSNATKMAVGMGANVTVLDKSLPRLRQLNDHYANSLNTLFANQENLEKCVATADLVIGAVLLPGRAAPHLVTEAMVKTMRPGSVIVDVAIDQGGCIATSRPTSHQEPTFIKDGIVHYCVTNMPGAVPKTSTQALNNVTLPHVLALAEHGYKKALQQDSHLLNGLNVCSGKITNRAVADSLAKTYSPASELLK